MVEAYIFFFDQLHAFFVGDVDSEPLAEHFPLLERVDECFQTLRRGLMVVVIDLQKDDDPQVIFETLNARGEPLLPADLLRNYIFFRANRENLDVEVAYARYWARFDDDFWRTEVKQGRLNRPRSDLFMQHFMASKQGQDIPIKHLYVEYRHWIELSNPYDGVEEELQALARNGDNFRRIISPSEDDVLYDLCTFLESYDIRTAYPLLLALTDANLSKADWQDISDLLESYLLRRAVCDLGTKNYNRVFLGITRTLRKDGFSVERMKSLLLAQHGESVVWPDDTAFREAFVQKPVYGALNSSKLVHLFGRLNQSFMSSKSERVVFDEKPSVEHIMPQNWIQNWPLPNGTKGMDHLERFDANEDDPRAIATRARDRALQTLGNLTILSTALNSAQSNMAWTDKRPELMKHSLLPINQSLLEYPIWDEEQISARGEMLFERAKAIWKR
jgi:hypothetical protein